MYLQKRLTRHSIGATAAFTLLEMLVAVVIVGILLALLLPAIQSARLAAARSACASNLRQLALSLHLYSDSYHQLPIGCDYPFRSLDSRPELTQPGVSWHTTILPYIEQDSLFHRVWTAQQRDPTTDFDIVHQEVRRVSITVFRCPSDSRVFGGYDNGVRWATTSYLGVAGTGRKFNDGVFHRDLVVRLLDITDGTSTTFAIGERPAFAAPNGEFSGWYGTWGSCVCLLTQILSVEESDFYPNIATDCPVFGNPNPLRSGKDDGCHLAHFWSRHTEGANFAFVDGSVRFLRRAHHNVLHALATRAGEESVNLD